MRYKLCTKCKLEKTTDNFYKDNNSKSGFMSNCKECCDNQKDSFHLKNPWKRLLVSIKYRCNNPKSKDYKDYGLRGIKCLITENEIKKLMVRDNYYALKRPTINRKDNDKSYTFDNCEFIEMGLNSAERNKRVSRKAVLQFDKQGNFIREWESQSEAARNLGLDTGNISSVCLEKVKTAGKFIWKFKKGE